MNNSNLHHSPRLGAEAAAALNAVEDQLQLAFDRVQVALAEFNALARWTGAFDELDELPWSCGHGGCMCRVDWIGESLQRRRARLAEDTARPDRVGRIRALFDEMGQIVDEPAVNPFVENGER